MEKNKLRLSYYSFQKLLVFERMDQNKIDIKNEINDTSLLDQPKNKAYKENILLKTYGSRIFQEIDNEFGRNQNNKITIKCFMNDESYSEVQKAYNEYENKDRFILERDNEIQPDDETFISLSRTWSEDVEEILKEYNIKELTSKIEEYEAKNKNESKDGKTSEPVSLCFIGPMSSGKSSLINAIIGYKVCPASSLRSTATIYTYKPKTIGQKESIRVFKNDSDVVEFEYSGDSNRGRFLSSNSNYNDLINNDSNKIASYEKCYENALKSLNSKLLTNEQNGPSEFKKIEVVIDFSRSLLKPENDTRFIIYDIPGKGSLKDKEDMNNLKIALSGQKHAIIVFVKSPQNSESKVTADLLNDVENLRKEKESENITLDTMQTYFVTTHMNEVISKEDRERQINAVQNDSFGSESKRFFLDSLTGYTAKKMIFEGETVSDKDDDFVNDYKMRRDNSWFFDNHNYYELDRIGQSKSHSQEIIRKAEDKLKESNDCPDIERRNKQMYVKSGLFSLEKSIKEDGKSSTVNSMACSEYNSVVGRLTDYSNILKDLIERINSELSEKKKDYFAYVRSAYDEEISNGYQHIKLDEKNVIPSLSKSICPIIGNHIWQMDLKRKNIFPCKIDSKHREKLISSICRDVVEKFYEDIDSINNSNGQKIRDKVYDEYDSLKKTELSNIQFKSLDEEIKQNCDEIISSKINKYIDDAGRTSIPTDDFAKQIKEIVNETLKGEDGLVEIWKAKLNDNNTNAIDSIVNKIVLKNEDYLDKEQELKNVQNALSELEMHSEEYPSSMLVQVEGNNLL